MEPNPVTPATPPASTPDREPTGRSNWRVLVLDTSDAADPKWVLASVVIPSDIRPADMAGSRYSDWPEVVNWVRHQVGHRVSLTPVSAVVWRVDDRSGS